MQQSWDPIKVILGDKWQFKPGCRGVLKGYWYTLSFKILHWISQYRVNFKLWRNTPFEYLIMCVPPIWLNFRLPSQLTSLVYKGYITDCLCITNTAIFWFLLSAFTIGLINQHAPDNCYCSMAFLHWITGAHQASPLNNWTNLIISWW